MGVGRSLPKSASGASKFISLLDRMNTKLQCNLRGFERLMNWSTVAFLVHSARREKNTFGREDTPYIN
eukprot:448740-Pelagomonas_calceolata.AAC.1